MEAFPSFDALSRLSPAVLAWAKPPCGGGSCHGGFGTGHDVALTGGGSLGPVLAVAFGAIPVLPVWVVGVEPITPVVIALQAL